MIGSRLYVLRNSSARAIAKGAHLPRSIRSGWRRPALAALAFAFTAGCQAPAEPVSPTRAFKLLAPWATVTFTIERPFIEDRWREIPVGKPVTQFNFKVDHPTMRPSGRSVLDDPRTAAIVVTIEGENFIERQLSLDAPTHFERYAQTDQRLHGLEYRPSGMSRYDAGFLLVDAEPPRNLMIECTKAASPSGRLCHAWIDLGEGYTPQIIFDSAALPQWRALTRRVVAFVKARSVIRPVR